MRSLTSVIDISDNMKVVNNHSLNQITKCNDEIRCTSDCNYRMNDLIIICLLILNLVLLGYQLLYYISEVSRERFSHLTSCILRRRTLGHLHQSVKGNRIPVLQELLLLLNDFQLLLGIVYEGGKRSLVMLRYGIAEFLINLTSDSPGAVLHHMVELLILSVYIRYEMLRSLRKRKNRLEIDNLGRSGSNCRKLLRQTL